MSTHPSSPEARRRRVIEVERVRQKKRFYIQGWKADRGCRECGESDPIVLDLHHRNPALKTTTMPQNLGWKRLHAELENCDVLCANCHRRETARQRGWQTFDHILTLDDLLKEAPHGH